MSKFSVDIRRIEKVWDHTNADRLSLAKVEGLAYQFVTEKDLYIVGDYVAYFPIDSILPPIVLKAFGLEGRLSGKEKNRLSTVKLRGEISQGFVAPMLEVFKVNTFENPDFYLIIDHWMETDDTDNLSTIDLSFSLGVTKYEQPPIPCHAGNLVALPAGVTMYDIEGCERYPEIVELLMDQKVSITEKLEGQNYGVTSCEGEIVVNQRNHAIKPIEGKEHSLCAITKELGLDVAAEEVRQALGATQVTLRGEYIGPGVQKNIYKLKKCMVRLFDILVDGVYLDPTEIEAMRDINQGLENLWVPRISEDKTLREWLDGRSIVEASHGQSKLVDRLREGIVIKPFTEQDVPEIGRLIIKQRDPVYLAKHGF